MWAMGEEGGWMVRGLLCTPSPHAMAWLVLVPSPGMGLLGCCLVWQWVPFHIPV